MACCHSLTVIKNVLAGDPMDLILFNGSGWKFEEVTTVAKDSGEEWSGVVVRTEDSKMKLKCLKQFTFSSQLKRMSIIVQNAKDRTFWIYCKGAPEVISGLCAAESVPKDFASVLNYYSKNGYRVIGLSCKSLESLSDTLETRDKLESNMKFLGLVVFENRLKPQTTGVISELNEANIRTVMITGDNLLTGISVAKECGILDRKRPIYILEASSSGGNVQLQVHPTTDDKPMTPRGLSISKVPLSLDFEKGISIFDAHQADYQLAIEGKILTRQQGCVH